MHGDRERRRYHEWIWSVPSKLSVSLHTMYQNLSIFSVPIPPEGEERRTCRCTEGQLVDDIVSFNMLSCTQKLMRTCQYSTKGASNMLYFIYCSCHYLHGRDNTLYQVDVPVSGGASSAKRSSVSPRSRLQRFEMFNVGWSIKKLHVSKCQAGSV